RPIFLPSIQMPSSALWHSFSWPRTFAPLHLSHQTSSFLLVQLSESFSSLHFSAFAVLSSFSIQAFTLRWKHGRSVQVSPATSANSSRALRVAFGHSVHGTAPRS